MLNQKIEARVRVGILAGWIALSLYSGCGRKMLSISTDGDAANSGSDSSESELSSGASVGSETSPSPTPSPSPAPSPSPSPQPGLTCPTGYIPVPGGSDAGSESQDFCVSKYHMKAVKISDGSKVDGVGIGNAGVGTYAVESRAENTAWTAINLATARSLCSSLGTSYHLITNAEWMTIARNIENNSENWSGNAVGSGHINTGHSDGYAISGQSPLAASTDDSNGCFGTGNANCLDKLSNDYWQKRTFKLSNDQVIWDMAGNHNAWVDADGSGGAIQYSNSTGSDWVELNSTVATNTYTSVTPDLFESVNMFPSGIALYGASPGSYGMGIIKLASSASVLSRAIMRGGRYDENLTWERRIGIFSAVLQFDGTATWSDLAMRCVYKP